ncbi:MAG: sigma-70 family RNA polymerase sigma factor [bacterium]
MKPPFKQVVQQYIRLIYYFTKRWCNDPDQIDDIVHDTLLKSLQQYDKFQYSSDSKLKSWLLTICKNTIIDRVRTELSHGIYDDTDIETISDESIATVLEDCVLEEQTQLLEQHLQKLSLGDQELVRLRVVENLSFKAISSLLSLTEAAAKMRFYRILLQLREAFSCK